MIIDQLPLMSGNPQDDDEFPIERGTTTYKTKLQALAAGIFGKIASSATPLMDGAASPGTDTSAARADHVHPTDTSRASAAELATYVRPNLLDNWYFVGGGSQLGYGTFPINQRRQTVYTGDGYCIDRWRANGSFTLASDGISIGSDVVLCQPINNVNALVGKQLSFSVLTADELITASFVFSIQSINYAITDDFAIGYHTSFGGFIIYARNANAIKILSAKLELGSGQTLAHQENGVWVLNEVPDYAAELAKCQAYLLPISALSRTRTNIVLDNVLGFDVPVPVTMAKTPAIIGTLRVSTLTGSFVSGFTFDVGGISSNAIRLRASKTNHGLTDGFIDSDAVWYLSAE